MTIKYQKGFTIVSAIFILVVLTLIGTYIVSIGALTRDSGNLTSQGIKTYYAAKSGLEWAAFRVSSPVGGPYNCPAASSTFNVSIAGANVYSVTVTCIQNTFVESSVSYNVFLLSATATFGTLGGLDYASRTVTSKVVQPSITGTNFP